MTATLQLLVLVVSAFAFPWYVLKRDKREHPAPKESQQSIYFPEQRSGDQHEHRGVAMSQLQVPYSAGEFVES